MPKVLRVSAFIALCMMSVTQVASAKKHKNQPAGKICSAPDIDDNEMLTVVTAKKLLARRAISNEVRIGASQNDSIAGTTGIESVRPSKTELQRKKRKDVGTQVRSYRSLSNMWRKAGMSNADTKRGWVALVHEPKGEDKIEYVAIFASGQQGLGMFAKNGKKNSKNIISGSNGKYRKADDKYWINGKSVSAQFARCENDFCFNPRTTLQYSVFDLRFEYQYKKKFRNAVITGWLNYLVRKVGCRSTTRKCKNLKAIYIAGGSRGGCFSMVMAKKLAKIKQFKHVKIIAQSFDGVCRGGEFGVTLGNERLTKKFFLSKRARGKMGKFKVMEKGNANRNPMQKHFNRGTLFFGWKTDVRKQFTKEDQRRVCLSHIAGGERVAQMARSFTDKNCQKEFCHVGDLYAQQWLPETHTHILRSYKLHKQTIEWSINEFKRCRKVLGLYGPGDLKP